MIALLPMLSLALLVASPAEEALFAADEQLKNADVDAARVTLRDALAKGSHRHADLVALLAKLGEAEAYSEDTAAAKLAFEELLLIEPGASLPYTTSPRATFAFEETKRATAAQRGLDVELEVPAFARLGDDLHVAVRRARDEHALVTRVRVLCRRRGTQDWHAAVVPAPPIGGAIVVALPRIDASDAVDTPEGPGVVVELAMAALDARNSEVWIGPTEARPAELPVGFDAPPPWWASWWLWGGVGGVTAIGVGVGVGAALWPLPEQVTMSARVTSP